MKLTWLRPSDAFPSLNEQTYYDTEVPGLVAASDTISVDQLVRAYQGGIFPWYSEEQPVLWWSPDPRMVLIPSELKISKNLAKKIRQILRDPDWEIRVNTDFINTIMSCANQNRVGQNGTWITHAVLQAYSELHQQGLAHSVETYYQNQCVGGLYCVNLGKMVYGESMFAKVTDASKLALAALCAWCIAQDIGMIDCQQETEHLKSLGGRPIPRHDFLSHLAQNCGKDRIHWDFNKAILKHWG